jgi:tetratricopeptide (TPR) repeat protein
MNILRRLTGGKSKRNREEEDNEGAARPSHPLNTPMAQNFRLIWLDDNIDEIDDDNCRDSITALRQITKKVNTFTDADECIDFIDSIKQEKVVMISSGALGETTVPLVHSKPQVSTIYIFCGNKARHEKWAKQWPKVKGVFTDITSICEALKQTTRNHDQNLVSISILKVTDGNSNKNLDELNPSFMYTQIVKEILLTIDFEKKHFKEFIAYFRKRFAGNSTELQHVDKIEAEYYNHLPIWWYTYESFLYRMANEALREMDVDLIVKMGFFIRNVHDDIVKSHSEQYGVHHPSSPFTVYRSQVLPQTDFEQLMQTPGGLFSFNNFLSTSRNREESLRFARKRMGELNLVSILFVITIDPSVSSTPFADVANESNYKGEEEILFSMHSVFRIGQIKQIDADDNTLWQVKLTSTSDSDPQLNALTECIRKETKGSTEWLRLGRLMVKIAQYDKAEELYQLLLNQKPDDDEKANIFHQRGLIKYYQGEYDDAIKFYEESLKIRRKNHSSEDSNLAECYNDFGLVYHKRGEYSTALEYYQKALEMRKKTLPLNSPDVAESYNNIAATYDRMGEDSEAISYYEQALKIYKKTLPPNHPDLAASHNNIGLVYSKIGDHSKAVSSLENALKIFQKILPPNHPDLAAPHNNIGMLYSKMGNYPEALTSHEKSLKILEKTLSSTHPHIAASHTNIGGLHFNMKKYQEALWHHKKAQQIYEKTLPPNHPDLAGCYGYIGVVSSKMEEHSNAVSYCERALKIAEKSLPPNHPQRQSYRKNLEIVKKNSC